MGKLKIGLALGITVWVCFFAQKLDASSPSIDLLLGLRANANNQSTTPSSSISQRIHASLNNVLRLPPLPFPGPGMRPEGQQQDTQQSGIHLRQQLGGTFGLGQPSNGAGPPPFLPNVNNAIQTIAQLSTLSHWPFGYVTTVRPQAQPTQRPVEPPRPTTQPSTLAPTAAPTTPAQIRTQKPTTAPPPPPTQKPTSPPLPLFLPPPPPPSSSNFQIPPPQPSQTARPSLPDRIHNRIHSTLNYIRLPSLSSLGNPRPRPMLTEPPWVTELLGPTLEPPTTRAPTIGERINNVVTNAVLFVPATLLNFWYQHWGTRHVDRVIQRLQLSTPKPASSVDPIAAISNQNNNILANLTKELGGLNNTETFPGLPAIAAFVNSNGTLMPTIVHPVVNMTTNTIEYQLRGEKETTVLWTGSLSNDIFFGNKKPPKTETQGYEDDEDEQNKHSTNILTIKLK